MAQKITYRVIGMMSGTSLDGLDIAFCHFQKTLKGWDFSIHSAETIRYSSTWLRTLSSAHTLSGGDLVAADMSYGKFLGKTVLNFVEKRKLHPDFIASHGHTIFHQPKKGFTYQLGNGNAIHAVTGIPVVSDFRTIDVLLGGEGAPLVPAGDKFLFSEYGVCLNLGGIANLSADINKKRIAFDICFANMGLNYLASKAGKPYDKNGGMANGGEIHKDLLRSLNGIYSRLRKTRPSLGREGFEAYIKPLLDQERIPVRDRLRTFTESAAREITQTITGLKKKPKVLCTGGGSFNSFLISRMLELANDEATFVIPEDDIVKFKEAAVFAFLGLLRVRDEINCLKTVTKASRNSSAGILVGF